jgi:hypothetical protein
MTSKQILDSQKLDKEPDYWFIGGSRYGQAEISIESKAEIEYPYTTYYTKRVQPFEDEGRKYIPLSEINLPVIVLQFEEKCLAAEIEPVIQTEEGPVHHFISYNKEDKRLEIVRPEKFEKKEKDSEWLGKAETREYENPRVEEYELEFEEFENWKKAVKSLIEREASGKKDLGKRLKDVFSRSKEWLYRSWDQDQGAFLQLPWRENPGFALDEYSYALTSNEAVRANYFDRMAEETGQEEFDEWSRRIIENLKREPLQKRSLNPGEGMAWYNSITFNGSELSGDFYLGTGYFGYPGGQSTISLNLIQYLERNSDSELEELVKENLRYILSTQKENGHWPAALKQEIELPFKSSKFYGMKSEGATGQSIRAMLAAYRYFGDEEYLRSAKKGLEALETDQPICRNGLRDIGTQEPEAFSAFSVIEAFLDAYQTLSQEKYLQQAETYCLYLSTWISTYRSEKLDLKGNCHPISETITQRISPYETVKASKTFLRANRHLESDVWCEIAHYTLKKAIISINDTGGMSEGIFYDFNEGINNLETEQTFATVELMDTILKFIEKPGEIARQEGNEEKINSAPPRIEDSKLVFEEKDIIFDLESFGFTEIEGEKIGQNLIFGNAYGAREKIKSRVLTELRKSKFLMAPKDTKYLWKGVRPGKTSGKAKKFQDIDKNIDAEEEQEKVKFRVETDIYDIEGEAKNPESGPEIDFKITTDKHDLRTDKVLLESNSELPEDVELLLENSESVENGFDISRKANWTHAGVYKGKLQLNVD